MHDGNSNGRYLVEDLRDIIRALKREGYRFTTPEEYFGVADDRTFAR
jgi:peptidoglycan/xylan/chitin deacetylase (PgdA/CDA1 family)